ncbi:MAG: hypothetical protein JRJ12_13970 [Deltaproteobacteria bacterium]|nr:hypothetical protein [Deltaproteobacteria bacterium]MBW2072194.1 hypothetical protein [Deltaproteobacteria bacterium]
MNQRALENFIANLSLDEIKQTIFSLAEQIFPVMDASEKQTFMVKLFGKSGDDKLSSMASR